MPAGIRHALTELPETLDETYQRTLREINEADWEFAHRLFQFVAVASRPLRVKELAELLAFDFKAGPIPEFHVDWRLEDPVDAVLSVCSSLLVVIDVEGSPIIQFSHFSVKEFLTSARLAEASNIIHRRYHVSMSPAHTLASQACLGSLLHLDEDVITRSGLEEYPLAEYAAENWVYHAQFEEVSQNVEDGLKQLFDPSKPHLMFCIWIYDPVDRRSIIDREERPHPTFGSPLHYAAFWGLHSIAHFLVIEHSQDVHSRNGIDDTTPLHLASRNGHIQVAYFLLERGADVLAQDMYGDTPLHMASRRGHTDVADLLIECGADASAQNMDGITPLHWASRQGHMDVAHVLVECGTDVSAQGGYGNTPLHEASVEGHMDIAHMLIECGAEISAPNKYGRTPLHNALLAEHLEVAHMLIERGADVSGQDEDEKTQLHLASERGYVDVAHSLIERGADISVQDKHGDTPLHLASQKGAMDVAYMLIERGAEVSAQNKYGDTPLHGASQGGYLEIAHMLIERGADVSAENEHRETPLHVLLVPAYYRIQQRLEVARILLEHGANVTAQDNDGLTPLDLASQDGSLADIAHILVQHGAGPGAH